MRAPLAWLAVAVSGTLVSLASPAAALTAAQIDSAAGRVGNSVQTVTTRLASDDMEGRNNLTPGSDKAQAYLIPLLRDLGVGLVGGGTDDESYRQRFPGGANLIAVIPGRELPDEYVIIGAHYDHLGRNSAGQVYNGATDNAAGVAAALAVGEAIADLPDGPRRSVVVAFWDAEEDGLAGSIHYVQNPIVPLAQTVAYVNFDIQGADLTPALAPVSFAISAETGGEMLRELVREAAEAEAARAPGPVMQLESLSYIFGQLRSDYASFVGAQVPTVFFSDATGACYHTVDDEARVVDFAKLREQARTAFRLTATLAESDDRPDFVAPNPALATYDDAIGLDRVFDRGAADLGLFRTEDRDLLRARFEEVSNIVARGPDAFGSQDVQTLLTTAVATLGAIESSLSCSGYFSSGRRPIRLPGDAPEDGRRPVGPARRLPTR